MASVIFDDMTWPIAYLRVNGKIAVNDMRDIFSRLEQIMARPGNFCIIVDLIESDLPALSLGTEVQQLVAPMRDQLRRRLMGTAIIVKSAAVRSAVNALLLVIRLPHPTRLVATRKEAEDYCRAALAVQKHAASA